LTRLRVGLSTCPNDTFAFAGLLTGHVPTGGLELDFELCDIQELNDGLRAGRYDVAKASFALALERCDDHVVLPVGAALGFGVGPVLLGAPAEREPARERVLAPGRDTTAALCLELLRPELGPVEHVVFSEIMPALARGDARLGACIHEGRFTWREHGLELVLDLGERWERTSGLPLALGGLLARRTLDPELLRRTTELVRASLAFARAHPDEALVPMRAHAQEQDDDVLWKHVELYVNDRTWDLGPIGCEALGALADRAFCAGRFERTPHVEVFDTAPSERLFHLAPLPAWRERAPDEPWRPSSLRTEGFVHLSYARQLGGTLATHFRGGGELALVELDPRRCAADVRVEATRGGAGFPHLRRPIEPDDVRAELELHGTAKGWTLPRLFG